ncbi:MAG: D-alanyl-D-alanine carboxypeptidase family protein [Alphaproteobacteria bacterium]
MTTKIVSKSGARQFVLTLGALLLTWQGAMAAGVQPISTPAKHAILIDAQTGTVLLEKAADVAMPPASMSKLMTIYMVFDRLKSGRLSLDDKFLVSETAWRKGGSKMFVRVKDRVSVRDLLRGIIVQSGNDACIVVAEGLAGTEAAFAEQMTTRARKLGLTNSRFRNSTGWPADGHVMSARDIASLSMILIREFPEHYSIFSEKTFKYNKIKQGNRNPLLYNGIGADGLKTGHTEASGYGLAASVLRNGRRLVLVINGLSSVRARSSESARLMEWGFRETGIYALFKKDEVVEQADVWLGVSPRVPLVIDREFRITLPRKSRNGMKAKVVVQEPLPAPIVKGTPIARLVVSAPGQKDIEVPLVAGESIARLGLFGRLGKAVQYLLWGSSG